jgi:hypothetical protein
VQGEILVSTSRTRLDVHGNMAIVALDDQPQQNVAIGPVRPSGTRAVGLARQVVTSCPGSV